MRTATLEVKNLSKKFDRTFLKRIFSKNVASNESMVLHDVNIKLKSGQIVGIVGDNGAGKTTFFRILADLLSPDSGEIFINGSNITEICDRKKRIGYVSSDERAFFWRLTGRENLKFFAGLYGINTSESERRIEKMLSEFSLSKKADQLFRDYSSGIRKKISIIRAMLFEPEILLMDEVTNSLDNSSYQLVMQLTREFIKARPGSLILWSTHRREELDILCDDIYKIEDGNIAKQTN